MGRAEDVAKKIRIELEQRGLLKEPLGIDVVEPLVLFALQREGITVVDGQELMSNAREIKTQDEITLLNMSAMMVDAAYYGLYKAMRPGMLENEAVALVAEQLSASARSTSKRSTPSQASAAARIRTSSLIARWQTWRSRLLRHPPLFSGVPHVLLPDVLGRLRLTRDGGRLQAVPRLSGARRLN